MNGLILIENFIDDSEENQLLESIDNSQWLNDLNRKVQHYGYKYDYKKRRIDSSQNIGKLP